MTLLPYVRMAADSEANYSHLWTGETLYLGECFTLIFRSPYVGHHRHYYPIVDRGIKVSRCSLT